MQNGERAGRPIIGPAGFRGTGFGATARGAVHASARLGGAG